MREKRGGKGEGTGEEREGSVVDGRSGKGSKLKNERERWVRSRGVGSRGEREERGKVCCCMH